VKLKEIVGIVGGTIITKQAKPDLEISSCGASDLMSDVLSFMRPGSLLLTGLIHPHPSAPLKWLISRRSSSFEGKNPARGR